MERKVVIELDEPSGSLIHAVAGGVSGMVAMAATYPLATLSTSAQANDEQIEDELVQELTDEEKQARQVEKAAKKKEVRAKSLLRILREIKTYKSFKQLLHRLSGTYGGLSTAVVGILATNFVYYYFYELTGRKLRGHDSIRGLNAKQSIIAGLVGGIVSRVVTNPIWVANTRQAVGKGGSDTTWGVLKRIVKEEGWQNLFAGLSPALLLVLSPVVQFTIYEQLKTLVVNRKKRALTAVDALYLGALGKLIATLITYPIYTIRSRMHMSQVKSSVVAVVSGILRNEGIQSFYSGLGLKLLQGILNAGFLFYFKEEFVQKTKLLLRLLYRLFSR